MVLVPVRCSVCGHDHIAKRGKTGLGKQRYLCQNPKYPVKTFILDYDYHGCVPNVKKKIIDMAMNGSGIRDTARVLEISPTTVLSSVFSSIDMNLEFWYKNHIWNTTHSIPTLDE